MIIMGSAGVTQLSTSPRKASSMAGLVSAAASRSSRLPAQWRSCSPQTYTLRRWGNAGSSKESAFCRAIVGASASIRSR
jgi:hypothetical protein